MKRGGEEIYVGPLGHNSCDLIKYFEVIVNNIYKMVSLSISSSSQYRCWYHGLGFVQEINGVSKIKDGYNPATWMLEVTTSAQEENLGINFTEVYKNSDLYRYLRFESYHLYPSKEATHCAWKKEKLTGDGFCRKNKSLIRELSIPPPGSTDLYFSTEFSQPFLMQCMACLWKQYKSYWRNPSYTSIRMFFTTIIAFIFGTIFWKLGSKTYDTLLKPLPSNLSSS